MLPEQSITRSFGIIVAGLKAAVVASRSVARLPSEVELSVVSSVEPLARCR